LKNRVQGFKGVEGSRGRKRRRSEGYKGSSEMLANYKELKVWQRAYRLCLEIYKITKVFPRDEQYNLTAQIRRSAVSIPSNIAEGYGRRTTPDYIRSLYISYGSICELETQIMIATDLKYTSGGIMTAIQEDIREIERMLKALIKSLENKP
jgi:four helix bundle protein